MTLFWRLRLNLVQVLEGLKWLIQNNLFLVHFYRTDPCGTVFTNKPNDNCSCNNQKYLWTRRWSFWGVKVNSSCSLLQFCLQSGLCSQCKIPQDLSSWHTDLWPVTFKEEVFFRLWLTPWWLTTHTHTHTHSQSNVNCGERCAGSVGSPTYMNSQSTAHKADSL